MSFSRKLSLLTVAPLFFSGVVEAFELASENTMSSVVIVAADSGDALVGLARTPDGYHNIRYELMPFKTSVSVDIDDIDRVSDEFDYAQVQAVDQQIAAVQQKEETNPLVAVLREYLPESVSSVFGGDSTETSEAMIVDSSTIQSASAVVFGQLEESFELVSASFHEISYNVTRYLEEFSAINVGFNPDDGVLGSFHISGMQSTSNITISEHD